MMKKRVIRSNCFWNGAVRIRFQICKILIEVMCFARRNLCRILLAVDHPSFFGVSYTTPSSFSSSSSSFLSTQCETQTYRTSVSQLMTLFFFLARSDTFVLFSWFECLHSLVFVTLLNKWIMAIQFGAYWLRIGEENRRWQQTNK